MSKIIASAAIRGAHSILGKAKKIYKDALDKFGPDRKTEFPNTAYFLPVFYGMTGIDVKTVGELSKVIEESEKLMPPVPSANVWLPYLGNALDAGMATLFLDEVIEVVKYLSDEIPYVLGEKCPEEGNFWLGAADDLIFRKRGIEFVDGTAPGFAAIIGAAPTNEIAVKIVRELQEKNIYIFLSGSTNGKTVADQLKAEKVQMGWETRIVPFGKDITATVFALGFATRVAMAFGGVKPGDFRKNLIYNKNRTFAFAIALGEVDDEKYAQAAGAINYGFPAIADTDIPQILPTGVCTYEHVISNVPHDSIVSRAIEVRGLKVTVHKVPIPVSFGPAFEGERIRKEDMHLEMGGQKTPGFEFARTRDMSEVEDGKIEVIGKEIDEINEGGMLPVGIVVEVAGRKMQADFEPILERYIHTFLNEAQGVWHQGQRDTNWLRISKEAKSKGFKLSHLGTILHAQYHIKYGKILDKVQVKIYTNEGDVKKYREEARQAYHTRDERIATMTDESVDVYYSCTLCQSFAPNHVCVITPERTGLCGSYSWLDGKSNYEIEPTGPNQPIKKEETLDAVKGKWAGIDKFVYQASRKNLDRLNLYSIMEDPMTSCGCFECISVILPLTNGIMTVNRECLDMTPCGMKFSTLAGNVGGGQQTPGFMGHSKRYIASKKFMLAEQGIKRLVWMPKALKEELRDLFNKRAQELGMPDLIDKIADEDSAKTEEEVLDFITKAGHPVLELPPLM